MGFEALPQSGPVTVESQETSPLFKFEVPIEAQATFLRVIALWRDNEVLGGKAPTFEIKAGGGVFALVGPNSGPVSILDRTERTAVGSVVCQRLPDDIFLLTISDLVENSGPWMIRITNNDAESLSFLGFSSHHEEETLQPWMVLGDPNPLIDAGLFKFVGRSAGRDIPVRNWGTAPLTIRETLGTPLGGEDSPVVLTERPNSVAPHRVDHLTIEAGESTFIRELPHLLLCNDKVDAHRQLLIHVEPERPVHHENPDGGSLGDDHPM
jgi:hypothetical protein